MKPNENHKADQVPESSSAAPQASKAEEKEPIPMAPYTQDEICPWCGYRFMELYLHFSSDDAEFECSQCGHAITGHRIIIFPRRPNTVKG